MSGRGGFLDFCLCGGLGVCRKSTWSVVLVRGVWSVWRGVTLEFVTEKPFWFCRGERICERNLEVLYKAESIEVTIGLRGWSTLWCLMDPLMDGGIASLECSCR